MSRRTIICAGLAPLVALSLAACESTQDKAKKVQEEGAAAFEAQENLTIAEPNKEVKVVDSTLLRDKYGDAIVVELRNTGKQPQVNLPILVDVRDAKGKSIYKNDLAGLEPSLNHVPSIGPGETMYWVNDQVQAPGAKSAKVTVGASEEEPPAELPKVEVGAPRVENDVSGLKAAGTVTNKSQTDLQKLVIFGVALQGKEVVAGGRGVIKVLKAEGKPPKYNVFFIGDPRGAKVDIAASPDLHPVVTEATPGQTVPSLPIQD